MAASQAGWFSFQALTNQGDLADGYRLRTYAAGTTTQKTAFTDAAGTISHTYTSDGMGGLYLALDARGELPAPLYLATGGYDIVLQTVAGATVWTRRAYGQGDAAVTLDAAMRADLADTADDDKGDALIGVMGEGTGAVATTMHEINRRQVSVFRFLSDAQREDVRARAFAQDLTVPLAAAKAYCAEQAALGVNIQLLFPAGGYGAITFPDWNVSRLRLSPQGQVELKVLSGSGPALNVNGAVSGGLWVYELVVDDGFILTGTATSTQIAVARKVSHCKFGKLSMREGLTYGLNIELAVLCTFDQPTVSINEQAMTTVPVRGMRLAAYSGLSSTANTVINPIMEGPQIGIDLNAADFNLFLGGTAEACTIHGVIVNTGSKGNQLIGISCEANTTTDILDQGTGTVIQGGYFTLLLNFSSAVRPIVRDVQCHSVAIDAATSGGSFQDIRYSSFAAGGTFSNLSTTTFPKNVFNGNTSALAFGDTIGRNPTLSLSAITVTASPFTYTNSSQFAEQVIVRNAAGTVTQIDLEIAGFPGSPTTVGGAGGLVAPGIHTVYPGDQLTVSYSGAVASIDMVRRPL